MKPIRILSPALDLQGEVDNYLSLTFCRSYHLPGKFQLVTNCKVQNTDKLNINSLIMLGADKYKTAIIRHKEIKSNERGEEILTVKGPALGVITQQRITIPPTGQAYDIQEDDAETVMKHYVQRNCKDIPEMKFPMLAIAENKNRGPVVKWQSRYKNLGEELEQISKLTGLGWRIYPDFEQKRWIFDICSGRDFSVNQNTNPPVIFSPEFENISSQEFTDSLIGFANYAVVAGQGEGVDREIVLAGSDATGLDKHVVFVDARDIKNSADLSERGKVKLAEHKRIISLQSEILTKGPFEYEKDWDVGDIVTVQNKDWNLTLDSRITEVEEIYEAGGFKLNVTFGSSLPTLARKLKSALGEIKIESTR
ncbi:Phage related protein [Tepidanaerobacter acetatoxydans Re1]|uniref:Phage related protein n=1 Tax=Tepidanaerobacter acetatoxydans (strain DSM 21804 / JCM 16047 / Re1) TaxID=1209989 RepID=F4LTA7_TEPAE|nr:siphovirus ReqiPepy6 Gp37-like family protein [Tepidanaerobacter acetatoxydans]AEE92507.1 phage related protein [Tepidanaerobacter acetatoxydans Re1]CDI41035.1 Phage related protein [Tepidanaerobacter acetatoxydans Re1]